ncbi:hypothetical protein P152DRAFT_480095 [Eremomyces bilateralis CBS 781.70]|uniref:Uncharacterized protein n=1 Tax=Eremomyces bilateralis CBS 781.70 TaxID=1392243 RepID=A0A6G1GAC6_9PEZI|nr:uncharacterized protein P152DRAFT_480095 [Eremomyces bilateralis CBS 781.70]KAF1814984.1 hypothetical protein P152DRAFT_480095 [Eremomyces bilateralis CBS 781.70]
MSVKGTVHMSMVQPLKPHIPTPVRCIIENTVVSVSRIFVDESSLIGKIRGYGLFTTDKIAAYTDVFRTSNPATWCVMPQVFKQACDNCFADRARDVGQLDYQLDPTNKMQPLIPCDGCKRVYYCDDFCRRAAWDNHHKRECQYFQEERWKWICVNQFAKLARLVMRLYSSEASEEQIFALRGQLPMHPSRLQRYLKNPIFTQTIRILTETMAHLCRAEGRLPLSWQDCTRLAIRVRSSLRFDRKPKLIIVKLDSLVRLYRLSPCHQFHMTYRIDLTMIYVCHSCDPNCHYFVNGKELVLRTLKPIQPGEQLTASLIVRAELSAVDRTGFLASEVNQPCECSKCIEEYFSSLSPASTALQTLSNILRNPALDGPTTLAADAWRPLRGRVWDFALGTYHFQEAFELVARITTWAYFCAPPFEEHPHRVYPLIVVCLALNGALRYALSPASPRGSFGLKEAVGEDDLGCALSDCCTQAINDGKNIFGPDCYPFRKLEDMFGLFYVRNAKQTTYEEFLFEFRAKYPALIKWCSDAAVDNAERFEQWLTMVPLLFENH